MKTVIAKLVELDRAAREMVDQAYAQQRQSEQSLAAELAGMEQDYAAQIKSRLELNRQQYEADTQAQVTAMKQAARKSWTGWSAGPGSRGPGWRRRCFSAVLAVMPRADRVC